MTRRERDTLLAIHKRIEQDGWAPSVEELAADLGLAAKSTVMPFLEGLERDGYITRGKGARMIRLTAAGRIKVAVYTGEVLP